MISLILTSIILLIVGDLALFMPTGANTYLKGLLLFKVAEMISPILENLALNMRSTLCESNGIARKGSAVPFVL